MKKNLRSALFLVSALIAFIPSLQVKAAVNTEAEETDIKGDSVFNARYVFANLHTTALEILPASIRLDLLDYWDVDSIYKASNVLGGISWIDQLTDSYAKIQISPVSNLQIKILPDKKGKLAMTIYTVGDDPQAADSEVRFYDESLSQLPVEKYLTVPPVKDFFEIPKGSATKMKEIEEMIPFPTIAYTAFPDNDNLSARLTVEQFINRDDWNIAKLFLKPSFIMEWKKNRYK